MCARRRCSGRPGSFRASRLACALTSGDNNHIPAMPRRTFASSATGSSASGTDWALGVEARSRALLTEEEAAERLYHEAIERLRRTRIRV